MTLNQEWSRDGRPTPYQLWLQAGGRREAYRNLMIDHGLLQPGPAEPLPCGWPSKQPGNAPCCDLHNQHCEPPADLCCDHCTEAAHPQHPPGVPCVLAVQPRTPTEGATP